MEAVDLVIWLDTWAAVQLSLPGAVLMARSGKEATSCWKSAVVPSRLLNNSLVFHFSLIMVECFYFADQDFADPVPAFTIHCISSSLLYHSRQGKPWSIRGCFR